MSLKRLYLEQTESLSKQGKILKYTEFAVFDKVPDCSKCGEEFEENERIWIDRYDNNIYCDRCEETRTKRPAYNKIPIVMQGYVNGNSLQYEEHHYRRTGQVVVKVE